MTRIMNFLLELTLVRVFGMIDGMSNI